MNTKNGMRRAKKEGRCVGTPPLGYSPARDAQNKPIILPNDKAPLVRGMFEDYATGTYTKEDLRLTYRRRGLTTGKSNIIRRLSKIFVTTICHYVDILSAGAVEEIL